jgi:membrane dipeptidase
MTTASSDPQVEARVDRLQAGGVVDMHYDLLMDLYEKRQRRRVLADDHLAQLRAGGMGVLGAAIYLEDKYLPEMALRVALDQVARLYAEVAETPVFAVCKNGSDLERARQAGQIALVITMEGVEPLGTDLDLLRVFYELGVRSVGLTHVRRNLAGDGGIMAPSGSPAGGLSGFGKALVKECQGLGMLLDLAHLNPAGVEDVLSLTEGPLIISHTNPRAFYDIERNSSDAQIKAVGARGGVIGVNAVLVSDRQEEATLDRYVDHIEHIAGIAGIDGVGLGFDFFKFVLDQWPPEEQAKYDMVRFVPDLLEHGQARNVTRRLMGRGWGDEEIGKVLYGNWRRVLAGLELRDRYPNTQ